MNLIRKLKISKLIEVSFNDIELEVLDYINSVLNDLIIFHMDCYPEVTFFINSKGECILEQNNKKDILSIAYHNFWKIVNQKYKIHHEDLGIILKYLIENKFNQYFSSPIAGISSISASAKAEEAYRNKLINERIKKP